MFVNNTNDCEQVPNSNTQAMAEDNILPDITEGTSLSSEDVHRPSTLDTSDNTFTLYHNQI